MINRKLASRAHVKNAKNQNRKYKRNVKESLSKRPELAKNSKLNEWLISKKKKGRRSSGSWRLLHKSKEIRLQLPL